MLNKNNKKRLGAASRGYKHIQIIVYRLVKLGAHRRDNSRIVRELQLCTGGRFVNRPYEYTIKLIKSTILIRREATPNLFTITAYLLPRASAKPQFAFDFCKY